MTLKDKLVIENLHALLLEEFHALRKRETSSTSIPDFDGLKFNSIVSAAKGRLYNCDKLYTGFTAEHRKLNLDKRIYEGDVFRETTDAGEKYCVVSWINQLGAWYMVPIEHYSVILNNDVSKDDEFDWLFVEARLSDFSSDVLLTKVGCITDDQFKSFIL